MKATFGSATREILTSDGESRPRYRRDVDGLRAIAILAVVLYHAHAPGFAGGYIGVDIFFVISGFLIGGIVYRDVSAGRFSFATFYARRARRILPALLGMTTIMAFLAMAMLAPDALRDFAGSDAAALLGVANIRLWALTHYFNADWQREALAMTWSLGVEEQFYLFLPPMMLLLHRLSPRSIAPAIALLSVVSLALSAHLARSQPSAAFYLLPSRAWELGVGVLVALWFEYRPRRIDRRVADPVSAFAMIALAVAILCYDERTVFPGIAALVPVFGTAALIATEPSLINRVALAAPPMRLIGLVSYSWYLWHVPPIVFARLISGREPTPIGYAALVLLSFAAAWLSWKYVEAPFRRPGTITSARLLRRYGAALLAGLGLSAATLLIADLA